MHHQQGCPLKPRQPWLSITCFRSIRETIQRNFVYLTEIVSLMYRLRDIFSSPSRLSFMSSHTCKTPLAHIYPTITFLDTALGILLFLLK